MNGAGRRVIITGAASGIGAAAAAELRSRGAVVIGLDLQAAEDVIACDVRDQGSVDAAVAEAITILGGLDVLVNNAGIGIPQRAADRPDSEALSVIDVNMLGPWRVTAAAMPALRQSRGRVVNVASGLVHLPMPLATAYCMSKRGLVAYSDALRVESEGAISVTTVYPGYVRTPIHEAAASKGLSLEGAVPAETLEGSAHTITRAVLGRTRRDMATTRWAAVAYRLLGLVPAAVLDRLVSARMRALALGGA